MTAPTVPRPAPPRLAERGGIERRFVVRDARAASPDPAASTFEFQGHAIVYDEWTEVYDYWWDQTFRERIARGAATETIGADDVRFLLNHDPNFVLARRRGAESDTLRLSEDETGLLVEASMDGRISYVRDLAVALERGDISGMSFAFEVLDESWDTRPDGTWLRTIEQVRLYDVAVVTYPAYEGTDGGLRSLLGLPDRRSLRRFIESRKGRRNSAGDTVVIRSAVDGLRSHADELEALLTDEETADESGRAAALAADDLLRHRGVAVHLGLAP